jgi:hypothetical protein
MEMYTSSLSGVDPDAETPSSALSGPLTTVPARIFSPTASPPPPPRFGRVASEHAPLDSEIAIAIVALLNTNADVVCVIGRLLSR